MNKTRTLASYSPTGFPEHMPFAEFRHRFDLLAPPGVKPTVAIVDEKQATEALLTALEVDKATYRIGLSQVGRTDTCLRMTGIKCVHDVVQ